MGLNLREWPSHTGKGVGGGSFYKLLYYMSKQIHHDAFLELETLQNVFKTNFKLIDKL